jgi:hypothetical protein
VLTTNVLFIAYKYRQDKNKESEDKRQNLVIDVEMADNVESPRSGRP